MAKNTNASFVTPEFIVSYPSLFSTDDNGKYKVTMVFPEGTDLTEMKKAVKEALPAGISQEDLKKFKLPFKDGNEKYNKNPEANELYKNAIYMECKSEYAPTVVDQKRNPILTPEKLYAGCYARAYVNAFAWHHKTNGDGISFGLQLVQKVREGKPLTKSSVDPKAVFGEIAGETPAVASSGSMDFLNLD